MTETCDDVTDTFSQYFILLLRICGCSLIMPRCAAQKHTYVTQITRPLHYADVFRVTEWDAICVAKGRPGINFNFLTFSSLHSIGFTLIF